MASDDNIFTTQMLSKEKVKTYKLQEKCGTNISQFKYLSHVEHN